MSFTSNIRPRRWRIKLSNVVSGNSSAPGDYVNVLDDLENLFSPERVISGY